MIETTLKQRVGFRECARIPANGIVVIRKNLSVGGRWTERRWWWKSLSGDCWNAQESQPMELSSFGKTYPLEDAGQNADGGGRAYRGTSRARHSRKLRAGKIFRSSVPGTCDKRNLVIRQGEKHRRIERRHQIATGKRCWL
uniref:(northern house mosquito) hypothetical protein n=1 Tax=Culex pipiens TaxID=7175 RepID=A0A8D8JRL7_CULPI